MIHSSRHASFTARLAAPRPHQDSFEGIEVGRLVAQFSQKAFSVEFYKLIPADFTKWLFEPRKRRSLHPFDHVVGRFQTMGVHLQSHVLVVETKLVLDLRVLFRREDVLSDRVGRWIGE